MQIRSSTIKMSYKLRYITLNYQPPVAIGSESVLYRAEGNMVRHLCVKEVRRDSFKDSNHRQSRESADRDCMQHGINDKARRDSYKFRVQHLRTEAEVGKTLYEDGEIPVVQVYAFRRVGIPFFEDGYDLVMEYVPGKDLSDKAFLDTLSFEDKLNYFFQTALALKYVHGKGYLHLDGKPRNIMVSNGHVKLIDFAYSLPIGTIPSFFRGTPGYSPPEQILCRSLDGGTDVFSFGVAFNVIFGGPKINEQLRGTTFLKGWSEGAFNTRTPAVETSDELKDTPRLAELIKRCTIPRRKVRVHNTDFLIDELWKIGKELGIKLTETFS